MKSWASQKIGDFEGFFDVARMLDVVLNSDVLE